MSLGRTLILGDSYSTFEGAIPEGYVSWFFYKKHEENDVNKPEQTWWYQVFDGKENILVRNESYSGTTVCNNVRPWHSVSVSFINRFERLVTDGFFDKNSIDTVLVFGGTNDNFTDCVIGKNQYDGFSDAELLKVLPAFGYLAKRISESLPGARVCWLINTDLKPELTDGVITNALHFGQEYILFDEIDKLAGHPSIKGMAQIAKSILDHFK